MKYVGLVLLIVVCVAAGWIFCSQQGSGDNLLDHASSQIEKAHDGLERACEDALESYEQKNASAFREAKERMAAEINRISGWARQLDDKLKEDKKKLSSGAP